MGADATALLVPLDSLHVEVLSDDASDTYVSKTVFAESEMFNALRGGATEISGETLLDTILLMVRDIAVIK